MTGNNLSKTADYDSHPLIPLQFVLLNLGQPLRRRGDVHETVEASVTASVCQQLAILAVGAIMIEGHLLATVGEFDPQRDELQGLGTVPHVVRRHAVALLVAELDPVAPFHETRKHDVNQQGVGLLLVVSLSAEDLLGKTVLQKHAGRSPEQLLSLPVRLDVSEAVGKNQTFRLLDLIDAHSPGRT
jgi:hypothetical protein